MSEQGQSIINMLTRHKDRWRELATEFEAELNKWRSGKIRVFWRVVSNEEAFRGHLSLGRARRHRKRLIDCGEKRALRIMRVTVRTWPVVYVVQCHSRGMSSQHRTRKNAERAANALLPDWGLVTITREVSK